MAAGALAHGGRSAGYLAPPAVLGAFVVVFALALIARRLLGLQGGLLRTVLCAVLGLASVVERDLDIVLRVAGSLEQRAAWARDLGVVELARGFAAALREELDFRVEARNLTTIAASSARHHPRDQVRLPQSHDEFTTQALERSLGRLMARYLSPGLIPDTEAFAELFRIVSAYGVAVPQRSPRYSGRWRRCRVRSPAWHRASTSSARRNSSLTARSPLSSVR